MISLEQIQNFYPPVLRNNPNFRKYILKEYIQLLILDFLSTTPYVRKITFIGGTNLRLIKGIDRFSEDLDFDCKGFTVEEFNAMTDLVLSFLNRSGLEVESRDRQKESVKAFRRNLHFPELLFTLGLSGHREARFLIKIESEDQLINYQPVLTMIKGCGMFFPFPVPPDSVLCSMKLSALLARQKGRDFYDAMFLLGQSPPDYTYLKQRCNIDDQSGLIRELIKVTESVDLNQKARDFDHLLFNRDHTNQILNFRKFILDWSGTTNG